MTQRDNILQELRELESKLADLQVSNTYHAPIGYFDDLAGNILNRVKALDANDPRDEINFLSPFLSKASVINPYSVPNGYFESLEKGLVNIIKNKTEQTAQEELEELSPLLSGLKKQTPYSVPQGYFEDIDIAVLKKETTAKAKVVSIGSKWFRYAAAAAIISFVAIGAFIFLNKKDNINPDTNSYAWVKKNMKKISTEAIDSFIITEKDAPVIASAESEEIKELMKGVSDKELQDFLKDTEGVETEIDDDLLLN